MARTPWGKVKVDARTGAIREGTVSVFNPQDGSLLKEITVGLHPNDINSYQNRKTIFVANANSDNVSVIDSQTDEVIETISVRLGDVENPYFGDSHNGLGITSDRKTLFVFSGIRCFLFRILKQKAHGWQAPRIQLEPNRTTAITCWFRFR